MKNIYKYVLLTLVVSLSAGFLTSCDDDDDETAPRLFRPQFVETTTGGTYFQAIWDKYEGTESFELQLSVDTFKTILREEKTDSTQFTFLGLEYDSLYQVRIKSLGSGIESLYFESSFTTSDYPTALKTISGEDIIDTQVRINWSYLDYDLFEIRKGKRGEVVQEIDLTDANNEDKELIVSKLEPSTSYSVYAYNKVDGENVYMGKKLFKTVAAQVYEGEVIDLRELTDEECLTIITPSYVADLNTDHPNGVTFVLKGGATYNITSTINISGNTTFITGLSLSGRANLALDANFLVPAATDVSTIRFENIILKEGASKGTAGSFDGTYVFNLNGAKANIDNLIFEGCDIRYKRGVIRMQTEGTINNVVFNNCVIDQIKDYAVVHNGNDAAYFKDIKMTNSTVSNAQKIFVCGKKLGINSIYLENNTFCYSPNSGQYFLDYNGNDIPGGITIKKCLFGPGIGSAAVNGIRYKSGGLAIESSYRTSDLEWAKNAAGTEPNAPIEELVDIKKKVDELFKDPENLDFTVTDATIKEKNVGDPRWLN